MLALTFQAQENLQAVTSQITGGGYVGNLLVVIIFLIVIIVYGFLLDRHNMVMNLVGGYFGLLVVNFFPNAKWGLFGGGESWIGQLVLFVIAATLAVVILSATHIFKAVYTKNFIMRWWYAVVSGILYAGLLVSIVLSILPAKFLTQFSPAFLNFFISDTASFLWLVLPLIGLLFIRYSRRGPGRPAY